MNKWLGVFVRFFFFFFVGVYLWAVPAFLFSGVGGDWLLPFESVCCGLLSLVCFGKCVGVVWRGFQGEFGKKKM